MILVLNFNIFFSKEVGAQQDVECALCDGNLLILDVCSGIIKALPPGAATPEGS